MIGNYYTSTQLLRFFTYLNAIEYIECILINYKTQQRNNKIKIQINEYFIYIYIYIYIYLVGVFFLLFVCLFHSLCIYCVFIYVCMHACMYVRMYVCINVQV